MKLAKQITKSIKFYLLATILATAAHAHHGGDHGGGGGGGGGNFTNVALNKPTEQSTAGVWNGVPSRAVDNNTSGVWGHGSVTHTDNEHGPWWTVDLESKHYVDRVSNYLCDSR